MVTNAGGAAPARDGTPAPVPTGPRLLASTAPLAMRPLGWSLDAIAEAGFAGVELLIAQNPESQDPRKVLALAGEAGLVVPVVHGPYMLLLRNVLGSTFSEKTRRSFAFAADIGAGVVVAHAPFRWERRARAWLERDAEGEAAARGVTLGMENLYPVAGRAFSSVITVDQLSPFSSVVFDTSHFGVAGVDLFEAWDALGDRVAHMHLSDNFGNGKDSHAPLGTGVLPLDDFLAHVARSGYTGTITLELDCRAYADSRESLVAFLAGERRKASAMLQGAVHPAARRPASDVLAKDLAVAQRPPGNAEGSLR